jgi:hypothetical protein
VKLTPALLLSLATTAVMPTVESVLMEVGGVGEKLTTIAGGWYLGSPQANSRLAKTDVKIVVANRCERLERKKVI